MRDKFISVFFRLLHVVSVSQSVSGRSLAGQWSLVSDDVSRPLDRPLCAACRFLFVSRKATTAAIAASAAATTSIRRESSMSGRLSRLSSYSSCLLYVVLRYREERADFPS